MGRGVIMIDVLPALLWIMAAVIAVNICSITAVRGNIFASETRDVHPVRWSIIALHFTSLVLGAASYPVYSIFESSIARRYRNFYTHVGWPSAVVLVLLIACELLFMYLQARNGMKGEMKRRLERAVK